MSAIPCKATAAPNRNNSAFLRDLMAWNRQTGGDNDEQMERLRQNLRRACEAELTSRQRHIVKLYFEQGLSVTEIARREGLHKSSVSRTLRRAKERLRNCLQYSL